MGAPPIIVIGMHRSGTSLVSRCLEDMGVFMGWRKDENNESIFFQKINDWMLKQSGASWDNPLSFDYVLNNKMLTNFFVEYVDSLSRGYARFNYSGFSFMSHADGVGGFKSPWGWKDPRNTFTLPVWLKCYPDAKIIHVTRHGVDVAESLRARADMILRGFRERIKGKKPPFSLRRLPGGFFDSARSFELDNAFLLWKEYIERGKSYANDSGDYAFMEIKYEDLILAPEEMVPQLAAFCGVELDKETTARIAAKTDSTRAYSYRKNEQLAKFAQKKIKELAVLDY